MRKLIVMVIMVVLCAGLVTAGLAKIKTAPSSSPTPSPSPAVNPVKSNSVLIDGDRHVDYRWLRKYIKKIPADTVSGGCTTSSPDGCTKADIKKLIDHDDTDLFSVKYDSKTHTFQVGTKTYRFNNDGRYVLAGEEFGIIGVDGRMSNIVKLPEGVTPADVSSIDNNGVVHIKSVGGRKARVLVGGMELDAKLYSKYHSQIDFSKIDSGAGKITLKGGEGTIKIESGTGVQTITVALKGETSEVSYRLLDGTVVKKSDGWTLADGTLTHTDKRSYKINGNVLSEMNSEGKLVRKTKIDEGTTTTTRYKEDGLTIKKVTIYFPDGSRAEADISRLGGEDDTIESSGEPETARLFDRKGNLVGRCISGCSQANLAASMDVTKIKSIEVKAAEAAAKAKAAKAAALKAAKAAKAADADTKAAKVAAAKAAAADAAALKAAKAAKAADADTKAAKVAAAKAAAAAAAEAKVAADAAKAKVDAAKVAAKAKAAAAAAAEAKVAADAAVDAEDKLKAARAAAAKAKTIYADHNAACQGSAHHCADRSNWVSEDTIGSCVKSPSSCDSSIDWEQMETFQDAQESRYLCGGEGCWTWESVGDWLTGKGGMLQQKLGEFRRAIGGQEWKSVSAWLLGKDAFSEWQAHLDQEFSALNAEYTVPHDACLSANEIQQVEGESSEWMVTGTGMFDQQFVGSIKAEKSTQASVALCSEESPCTSGECKNNVCYDQDDQPIKATFYKISWGVKIPKYPFGARTLHEAMESDNESIEYNVELTRSDGNTIFLYPAESTGTKHTLRLSALSSDKDVFMTYSVNDYSEVCIVWGTPIIQATYTLEEAGSKPIPDICATFKESNRGEVNWKDSGMSGSSSSSALGGNTAGQSGRKSI